MNAYEQRQWQVIEAPFRRHDQPHTETIYTIGNGLVGVRGSFEEGYPGEAPLTLAAGIFNQHPDEQVPDLVAMPNWLALTIRVNGERFRMDEGRILGYERRLDLKNALHWRGVLWLSPNRVIVRLAFERFASAANPHIFGLQVLIQVLSEGQHQIEIESALDGTVTNVGGFDHWQTLSGTATAEQLNISGEVGAYQVAMSSSLSFEGLSAPPTLTSDQTQARRPSHNASFALEQNQKVTLTKLVTLHTSRDSDDPRAAAENSLQTALSQGYEALKADHINQWADYWADLDIEIEGDELAQRALRFCTYHMLIAAPTHEERVSIGAKSLSGSGYKGHVFWDTELFLVPPLTFSRPELAHKLLMYRYHNLEGARAKAAEAGYLGAMFPWESTDTGEETTPRFVPGFDGQTIRIWTGDNEQHISSDIAYAILQYWRWTGDDAWFKAYGAEMVLDTAKFWGSRAEYNAEQDRYELRQQIGPDEYHENVDNSVFTNRLTVWHLEQALGVWAWLQQNAPDEAKRLQAMLKIDDATLALWEDIARKMWIPLQDGVLVQFENFFERLQPFNLADYTPRVTNMDWILGHEKTQTARVIKQADVVMLMYLLGEELGNRDFLLRNWEVYSKVVDHGSSLSPAIHALVAARLGLIDEAYDLFIYAATIDLEDKKGNVRDGIHAASCGGVWQAVVLGFCGLELTPEGITTKPNLPAHWRKVSFTVYHQGQRQRITIE